MRRVRSRLVALAAAATACASSPELRVAGCEPAPSRPPRVTRACFEAPGSQAYAASLAREVGETLSGWKTHPGAAELSVAFSDDSRIGDVCYDRFDRIEVASRILDLPQRFGDLPPAPACFAGHRLDFAWESDVVTDESLRQVVQACRRRIQPQRRAILFIQETQRCAPHESCTGDDIRGRWNEADRALRSCVLEQVPLTVRSGIAHEALVFDAAPGLTPPDPDEAAIALRVCNGLPHRSDVVECMGRHGWVPRP